MTGWVILVDQARDLPNAETPHKVISTSEYLARPRLFDMGRPKLVNLARSYAYQSKGYYASLLAEARGHRVVPTVETMLELREQKLYEHALPDLEEELNRCARRADFQPDGEFKLLVCFGIARDERFEPFGRLLFDWFRCPALEVIVEPGNWLSIDRIRPRNITRLANGEAEFFRAVAAQSHQARMARSQGALGRQIRSRGALRSERENGAILAGFDQAFRPHRRENVGRRRADHQAPARRACRVRRPVHPRNHLDRQSHLPFRAPRLAGGHAGHRRSDLDDPLHQQGLPDGAVAAEPGADAADRDHCRGHRSLQGDRRARPAAGGEDPGRLVLARRAQDRERPAEFKRICDELFEETDLLLAQKFLPTDFDWRVGVLAGEPLFVCQYRMARGHWQVVKYRPDGSSHEGGFRAFDLDQAPREVIDIAVRAARPIGDGFYGVDLKQTDNGIVVMEVNDNPSLEHGIEDAVGKDEIWSAAALVHRPLRAIGAAATFVT